jgi:hypothetical protein
LIAPLPLLAPLDQIIDIIRIEPAARLLLAAADIDERQFAVVHQTIDRVLRHA